MGYVHIDDVALCHILLYENKASHGRYLCSSTIMENDELVSMLATRYPGFPIPKRLVNATHIPGAVWIGFNIVLLRK